MYVLKRMNVMFCLIGWGKEMCVSAKMSWKNHADFLGYHVQYSNQKWMVTKKGKKKNKIRKWQRTKPRANSNERYQDENREREKTQGLMSKWNTAVRKKKGRKRTKKGSDKWGWILQNKTRNDESKNPNNDSRPPSVLWLKGVLFFIFSSISLVWMYVVRYVEVRQCTSSRQFTYSIIRSVYSPLVVYVFRLSV